MESNVNLSIRSYRESAGLTQAELGQRLGGVTRQTIAAWEQGESTPTLATLLRIAEALGVPVSLLLGSQASERPALLFRADDPKALLPGLRAYLTQQATEYAAIERLAGEVPSLPEARPLDTYEPETIENIASEIRAWIGVAQGPIYDALSLLDDKGLKVIACALPEDVFGFSAYTEELGGVIFVNASNPPERQYFTAMHELAHLVLHRREYQASTKASGRKDPREDAANHLAGAILLPRDVIEKELRFYKRGWIPEKALKDLKLRYMVSMRTVLMRASQVGLIPKHDAGRQIGYLNKRYGKDSEPAQLPEPDRPRRLNRLVFRVLLKEKITASRAAEVLGRPLWDVRQELSEWMESEPD